MKFFTEHSKLPNQTRKDVYGPAKGDEGKPDSSNIYNVTAQFKLTQEAKAYACQTGMLIVQQSDVSETLVNVIIKPNGLNNGVDAKYYIYRGIKKEGLLNQQSIAPKASSNNDLITRIWNNPPEDLSSGTLGFDNNILTNFDDIETIYDGSRSDFQPIYIREGETFGNFTTTHKIGFEIVQKTNRFVVTLGHIRSEKHQINVTNLTGHVQRAKREEILNFIDPAAFFGINLKKDKLKSVNKFYSKDRVYIDIRSEKGYSYNFYNNYNDTDQNNIQVGDNNGEALTKQQYKTNEWPIIYIKDEQTNSSKNIVKLKLRLDDNVSPIIYKNQSLVKTGSRYIRDLEKTSDGWTKQFDFKFDNTIGTSGKKRNIAYYIKLHYFRRKHNFLDDQIPIPTIPKYSPNTIPYNKRYYDSAFCSIDIPNLGNEKLKLKFVESTNPIYVKEPLNNTNEDAFLTCFSGMTNKRFSHFLHTLRTKSLHKTCLPN